MLCNQHSWERMTPIFFSPHISISFSLSPSSSLSFPSKLTYPSPPFLLYLFFFCSLAFSLGNTHTNTHAPTHAQTPPPPRASPSSRARERTLRSPLVPR